MANAATYISNLGKSISYSAVDRVKQLSPVTASMIDTNNVLFKEIYKGAKDYRGTIRTASRMIKSSKVYEAGDQMKKSLFEDIKTGNFYNKKRENEMQLKAMGSLGDFSDFDTSSFDDMNVDLGSDDGWTVDDSSAYIGDSVAQASIASSQAITKSIGRSAEYIAESNKAGAKMLYVQNAQAFSAIDSSLSAINKNISNVLEFSTTTLQTHAENSKVYFETTTKILNSHTELLQKMVDFMDPNSKVNKPTEKKKDKIVYSDIVDANGGVDLKEYAKLIKKNLNNTLGSTMGMNSMFGDDSNLLMAFAGSPLKLIPDMIVKLLIPKAIDKTMQEFNKSLEGFFGSLLMKFNTMAKSDNLLFKSIGKILGIENNVGTIETNNYNKGPVAFDGKTRKAIIEVIPAYLRRIEAALTGKSERIFDMDSGKFTDREAIEKSFESNRSSYRTNATSDMEAHFRKMTDQMVISNKDQYDQFFKDMEGFFKNVYGSGKLFNPNTVDNNEFGDYGVSSSKNLAAFKSMYKTAPRWMQQQINSNILQQRSNEKRYIESLNESGDSVYNTLYDNSDSGSSKDKKKQMPGLVRFDKVYDNLGHGVFYYMQNSLRALLGIYKTNKLNAVASASSAIEGRDISSIDDILLESDPTHIFKDEDINRTARKISDHQKKIQNKLKRNPRAIDYSSLEPDELENAIRSNAEVSKSVSDARNRNGKVSKAVDKYVTSAMTDEDGNVKNIEGSFFDKMLAATTLSEKSAVLIDSLNSLSKKPIRMISSLIDKADQHLYDIIYDAPIKDRDGKEVKGFLNAMVYKLESTFGQVNLWLDENIFEPLKKKFGVESPGDFAHKIVKNIFGAFGLDFDEIRKSVSEYLLGTKDQDGNRHGGLFGDIIQSSKNEVKGAFKYAKNSMSDVYSPAIDAIKYWGMNPEQVASRKAKDVNNKAVSGISNILKAGPPTLGQYNKINQIEKAVNGSVNAEVQEHANGTRYVTKTGLTAISEGEVIIPSELNPLYRKKTNKMSQQRREKQAKQNLVSKIAGVVGNNVKENAYGNQLVHQDINDNEKGSFGSAVGSQLMGGMKATSEALFGKVNVDKERFGKVIDKTTKSISEYAPTAIGGSIVGAGVSLITGAIGGPLLGAAAGAGIALVKESETVRKWLFGEEVVDENGDSKYTGGLISKDISNNIKKYLPDMAKYGTAGAITAILPFIPGGPVAGLMVGAGIGFAKNSEKIQKSLFGEDGILGIKDPKAFSEKIRNALPRMGAGAIAGVASSILLGGPFGIVGNAAIGAGLGLVSTTDSFQTFMFGEADSEGKRTGGLLGELKIAVVDPLKDFGKEFKNKVVDFIREEMAKPFKNAIKPISKQIELSIKGMFKFVGNSINKMFEDTVGIPLNHFLRDNIIKPFTKVFGGVFKVLTGPAKFVLSSPFKAIGAVGDHYRKKQIKGGNASYMTAQERLDYRSQKGMLSDKFEQFDQMLVGMDNEQINGLFSDLSSIKDLNGHANKQLKSSRKDMNKGISSIVDNHSYEKQLSMMIQKGQYGKAGKFISSLNYLSPEKKMELKKLIEDKGSKYATAESMIKDSDKTKNHLYAQLNKKYGFEGINNDNIQKYLDMFDKEKRSRTNIVKPSELTVDQKQNNEIIDITKKILHELKLKNDPDEMAKTEESVKDIIKKKTKVKQYKTVFDSYANPVRIRLDNQGKETKDINDTGTKASIEAQEERDATQRGIFHRLGWLENLKKLFGKKTADKEEPFWKKILKYLSIGAGILAAIYNDLPQKLMDFLSNFFGTDNNSDGGNNDRTMGDYLKHGLLNFTSRGFKTSKLLKRIPVLGKALGPVGEVLDAPARLFSKTNLGAQLMGKNALGRMANEKSVNALGQTVLDGKTFDEFGRLIVNGKVYTPMDSIKAIPQTIGKVAAKGKDLAETAYLKGLYLKDGIVGTKLGSKIGEMNGEIKGGIKNTGVAKAASTAVDTVKIQAKNMASSVSKALDSAFGGIIKNPTIQKYLGKEGMTKFQKLIPEIIQKASKEILGGGAKILGKAAKIITKLGPLTVFWVVEGFISGYTDSNRILGIMEDAPTRGHKCAAGLIRSLDEFLLFGLIPESWLVDLFMKYLAPAFGMEDGNLAKQRDAAQTELDKENEKRVANGEEELNMQQFLNSKGYGGSFATRTGKMIGNIIDGTGQRVVNMFKGKGFRTDAQVKDAPNVGLMDQLTSLGKKLISFGGMVLDVTGIKDIIDIALGKSKREYWDVSSGKPDEEVGLLQSMEELLKLTIRVPMYPVYLTIKGMNTVWEHVKVNPMFQKIMQAGSYTISLLKYNLALALGKTEDEEWVEQNGELISSASITDDDPMAGVKRLIFYSVNTALFVPFLVVRSFNKVWKKVKESGLFKRLSDTVGKTFKGFVDVGDYLIQDGARVVGLVADGSWASYKAFFTMTQTEDDTTASGALKHILFKTSRTLLLPGFTMAMLLRQVPDAVKKIWTKLKEAGDWLSGWKSDITKFADQKGWGGYWTNPSKGNPLQSVLFYMGRALTAPFVAVRKLLNSLGITKLVDDLKTSITTKFSKFKKKVIDPFMDFFGLKDYWKENKTGKADELEGDGTSGKGSGFVSQLDSSVKSKKFGNSTIGDSGCAPATAAMMINQLGNGVNIDQTAKGATKYQNASGSVGAAYFKDEFSKYGIDSNYTSNPKDMVNNLRSGNPMILLGQDLSNSSKSVSPYGSNGHYVMATGIDKNGNVIIKDPELKGQKSYNMKKILSHTNLGIAATRGGRGSGLFGKFYGGASNANETIALPGIANKDLRQFTPISDAELNAWINAKAPSDSPFRNRGSVFNEASRQSGLDPRYIFAHAAVESGWGKSHMGSKNNYFGIGAFDSSPYASAKYMGNGLKAGIIEGAQWIAKNYTNAGQYTLYLMIYGKKRYATAANHWINQISTIMSGAPGISSATYSSNTITIPEEEPDKSFDGQLTGAIDALSFDSVMQSEVLNFLHGNSNKYDYNYGYDPEQLIGSTADNSGSTSAAAKNADNWFLGNLGYQKKSSDFGRRMMGGVLDNHGGIDYAAPIGTKIKSPVSGTVTENTLGSSYGYNIKMKDKSGGLHIFAHMKNKSPLSVGSTVHPGDLVGYVGNTGHSTGPHTHYETRNSSGTKVNPNQYLASYNGGGTKAAPVIDISEVDNKYSKSVGGPDNTDTMKVALEIIKVLVKIVDNTDNLEKIVSLLTDYFTGTTKAKSGKGTGSSDSKETKMAKSDAKQQIIALVKQSNADNIDHHNKVLFQQLDSLARE